MSTSETSRPVIEPVHVHLASAEEGVFPAPQVPRPSRAVTTQFGTQVVDDTNKVRPLLPASPQRRVAYIQAAGGDVFLCDSESKASQAANAADANIGDLGMHLPSANTAPWPVQGQQAVWVAQVTATKTCVVSFTADYEG